MEIRSYRRVFDLERRIYRIDRLRLNPGGVPVRGVVYFLTLLAAALLVGRLPLLAAIAGALPWYMRDLALPIAGAAVLTVIRIEGRPFHLAAGALVRYRSKPRRLAGVCRGRAQSCSLPGGLWRPHPLLLLPDGSDNTMRRLRYTGPGAVLVAVAHRREMSSAGAGQPLGRRRQLTLHPLTGAPAPESGQVIVLARAARLLVR
jgi:hypothetical protein